MPSLSNHSRLVFQHDVRISRTDQDRARRTLCQRLKQNGWSRLGIEFLFIDLDEMTPGPEMKKQLENWRDFMTARFSQTYFSVHAPWKPDADCFLFEPARLIEWITRFQQLELDFIDCINVHPGHPDPATFQSRYATAADRELALGTTSQSIARLPRPSEIHLETIFPNRYGENYVAFIGCLPSHFARWMTDVPSAGWTLDTAHASITIDACKQMAATGRLEKGFFDSDWPEIRDVATRGLDAFLEIPNLRHVHLANWQPASSGPWDGFELDAGQIPLSTLQSLLQKIGDRATRPIGVNLEINETDYTNPLGVERSLNLFR